MLVSGVVMPGVDGYTLSQLLTETRPGMRVLLMSGLIGNRLVQEIVDSRKAELLQKPFSASKLAFKVRDLLDA